MMADRRAKLRSFLVKYPALFHSDGDSVCCTDAELYAIGLDLDSLLLSPKTRHLGVCGHCKQRLLDWQNQQVRFQRMAEDQMRTAQAN